MELWQRIVCIILGLFFWWGSQHFIGKFKSQHTENSIDDLVHGLIEPLHRLIYNSEKLRKFFLISSSLLLDLMGLYLIYLSVMGPSFKPFVGLFILFFLRQLNQLVTNLPTPKGMIWQDPGFPSIFVTYGVYNDLFFSGHTALAVFSFCEIFKLYGVSILSILFFAAMLYEIFVVLILKAHWTMDVYAGIISAILISLLI